MTMGRDILGCSRLAFRIVRMVVCFWRLCVCVCFVLWCCVGLSLSFLCGMAKATLPWGCHRGVALVGVALEVVPPVPLPGLGSRWGSGLCLPGLVGGVCWGPVGWCLGSLVAPLCTSWHGLGWGRKWAHVLGWCGWVWVVALALPQDRVDLVPLIPSSLDPLFLEVFCMRSACKKPACICAGQAFGDVSRSTSSCTKWLIRLFISKWSRFGCFLVNGR